MVGPRGSQPLSDRERVVLEAIRNGRRMTRAAAWKTTGALAERGLVDVAWVPTKKGSRTGEHVPLITRAGERALARNPTELLSGFEVFEGFEEDESQVGPRVRLIGDLGEEPQGLDATRLLKSTAMLSSPRIDYYRRSRAWSVTVPARTEKEARRAGAAVRKQLRGKRTLTSSDPFLHELPLYVVYEGGHVEANPRAPAATNPWGVYRGYHGTSTRAWKGRFRKRPMTDSPHTIGIWFGLSPEIAEHFAETSARFWGGDPLVLEADLAVASGKHYATWDDFVSAMREAGGHRELRRQLLRARHDAIVIDRSDTDRPDIVRTDVAVFDPGQITVVGERRLPSSNQSRAESNPAGTARWRYLLAGR